MDGKDLVKSLQERAARALPAAQIHDVGGWLFRYAPGCSWWVSTVLPHGVAPVRDLTRRIALAEQFYQQRGAGACFQVTPGACVAGLDAALEGRGYRRHDPVSLQVATVETVLGRIGDRRDHLVQMDDHPDRSWLDVWCALRRDDRHAEQMMLRRVHQSSTYASLSLEGGVVAIGRAVLDAGWAGVFDMGTLPEHRGKGLARSLLGELASWAAVQHVNGVYLQVECGNAPASRLYAGMGFRELRTYYYRS